MLNFFAIDGVSTVDFHGAALLHEVLHHISDLFHQERHGPFEEIHSLREMERMLDVLVLLDVHFVVLNEDDSTLVVVLSTVVRSGEDSDDGREGLMATPSVHLVSINLDLMSTNDRNKVVHSKDLLNGIETELDGTFTLRVRAKAHLASVTVIHWVGPKEIAEEALERGFNESVDALDVCFRAQLW